MQRIPQTGWMPLDVLPIERCGLVILGPPVSARPMSHGLVLVFENEVHVLIKLRLFFGAHME